MRGQEETYVCLSGETRKDIEGGIVFVCVGGGAQGRRKHEGPARERDAVRERSERGKNGKCRGGREGESAPIFPWRHTHADEACLAGSGTQTAGSLQSRGRWSGAGSGGRQGRRQRTRCNV